MNIIQGMHLSRMRIVLIAVVLAIAGLLVSASQIGAAGAATAPAAGGGGPKPTVVLEHGAGLMAPAGPEKSSGCRPTATPSTPRPTRCAAWRTTPPP